MKTNQSITAVECFHGRVQQDKTGQHASILKVMRLGQDYTGQQLAHLTGLTPNVISARLYELREELRWVERRDYRVVCPITNVSVFVHRKLLLQDGGERRSILCKALATRHGLADTRVHRSWMSMRQRCLNSNDKRFGDYGGRGISICERWMSFENFYADMGPMPDGFSIDRINVNGNYEPSNCRWADHKTQARNIRANRLFTVNGETHCLSEWAELKGLNVKSLSTRLDRGWEFCRALTTPFRPMKEFKRKKRVLVEEPAPQHQAALFPEMAMA